MKLQDTLFSMLPTREAVKEVYLNPETGVLAGIKAAAAATAAQSPVHKLIVECGTIESTTTLEVGEAVQRTQAMLPSGSLLGESTRVVDGWATLTFNRLCRCPSIGWSKRRSKRYTGVHGRY